ncbi:MAG: hypothetical protein NT123_22115 [Proteobacteria bacterium]|nr:hypothetical protein [Pseudomonadota bacterium]
MHEDSILTLAKARCPRSTDLSNNITITPRAKVSGMLAEGYVAGTGRKIAFDATASFKLRDRYERGSFATVNLADWLSSAEVDRVRSQQRDCLKSMLRRGY